MPSLSTRSANSDALVFEVRDEKVGDTGGGFWRAGSGGGQVCLDLNTITVNEIPGASLTNWNGSSTTTSSDIGLVGERGIVNNPDVSTHHLDRTWITLPKGKYTYVVDAYAYPSNVSGASWIVSPFFIYNITDDVNLDTVKTTYASSFNPSIDSSREYTLNLNSSKNIQLRTEIYWSGGSGYSATKNNLGTDFANIGATNYFTHHRLVFKKIG